jgi:uncharacterized protein (TIGR01777 family)
MKGLPGRVLVSGASGLIGRALTARLEAEGTRVVRLTRLAPGRPESFLWDPEAGRIDPAALDGAGAVVHLAGEPIPGLWTAAKKRRILESRVRGTSILAEAVARRAPPPDFVCASAVGFYGPRSDEVLTEGSRPGDGFLADVVRRWEEAADPAASAGARVAWVRIGIVLSPDGGALAAMLPAFRLGLGARIADGRAVMSWVALEDLVGAFLHVLRTPPLSGPVLAVAPAPVTQAEFARTLARVLARPAWLRLPAWPFRLLPGGMGKETVLASQRAAPRRLLESGYSFRHPELEGALRSMLGRPDKGGGAS